MCLYKSVSRSVLSRVIAEKILTQKQGCSQAGKHWVFDLTEGLTFDSLYLYLAVTDALLGCCVSAWLPSALSPEVDTSHVAVDVQHQDALNVLWQLESLAVAFHLSQSPRLMSRPTVANYLQGLLYSSSLHL